MSDVLTLQNPPVPPPESALIAGMAAPTPPMAQGLVGPGEQGMPDTSLPGNQQIQEPGSWSYDFNAGGVARATFNGEVVFTSGGSATSGVSTWNGRTGAVVLTSADVTAAGGAPLASPTFTGTPAAPTASPGTSTTQIATTAFVAQAITATPLVASFNGRTGAVSLTAGDITTAGGAVTASPAFTGTPTAPTAMQGTATGQLATTQFVANAIGQAVVSWNGRTGAVSLSLSDVQSVGGAPVASPAFTGTPTGPTAAPGTSTTQLASTAFVTNAVAAATAGVSSFNARTGAVTLQAADVTGVGGALLLSPTFTGTPAAPTVTAGDNSTKIATTAFVATAIGAMAPVVASFNARTGAVTLQAADVTGVGGALLASPVFTGTPAGPTPTAGDNSTRLATTAFVTNAVAGQVTGVTAGTNLTGGGTSGTVTVNLASTVTGLTALTAGQLNATGAAQAASTAQGSLSATRLSFKQTAGDETNAGQIDYGGFGSSLFIIGKGTAIGNRAVGVVDNLAVQGTILADSSVTAGRTVGGSGGVLSIGGFAFGGVNYGTINNPVALSSGGNAAIRLGSGTDQGIKHLCVQHQFTNTGDTATYAIFNASGTANVSGAWSTLSDASLKQNVQPYGTGLAAVVQLAPVTFQYISEGDSAPTRLGLIAQDVQAVIPEVVGSMEVDGETKLTLESGNLIYALINAVKELTARVEALESRA